MSKPQPVPVPVLIEKSEITWVPVDGPIDFDKLRQQFGNDLIDGSLNGQTVVGIPKGSQVSADQLVFEAPAPPPTLAELAGAFIDLIAPGIKDRQAALDSLLILLKTQRT